MYETICRTFDRLALAWLDYRLDEPGGLPAAEPRSVSHFERSCADYIETHAYGVAMSDRVHGAAFICHHHVH